MTISAEDATSEMARAVLARPWGLAVAAIADGQTCRRLEGGADSLSERSQFQVGSVTKTMTGVLLAQCVVDEIVELSTSVEAILGVGAGKAGAVTLLELATHRSGLPRLPPNLDLADVNENDPYANYTEHNLLEALATIETLDAGGLDYSNFGFMLLGLLLARVTGSSYDALVERVIFDPLGMRDSRCGVPDDGEVLPGYRGSLRVPWWQHQLPGPGGVTSSIADLATYVSAMLDPPEPLADAVELATARHADDLAPMGLGWMLEDELYWHNGATGGFRAYVAFHRPTKTGVAVLANSQDVAVIDDVGARVLSEMVASRGL